MNTTLTVPATNVQPVAPKYGDFGKGRYSDAGKEIFDDAQNIFKLSAKAADKLTHDILTQYGAAMAQAKVEIGGIKANKDNHLTLKDMASKVKGITGTNALNTLMAIQFANGAVKAGFNRNETLWQLNDVLTAYLASLEK